MVDEVVPQEQMGLFNRPKEMAEPMPEEMAEPMPEEMAMEEPQEELIDSGLRRDDPRVALGELATFLIDLEPQKINSMRSLVMHFPRITEAVVETTQTSPEELDDLFRAALGDPQANRRLLLKYGGEEAMAAERDIQEQSMQAQQMPVQQEQPPAQLEQGRGLALPQ